MEAHTPKREAIEKFVMQESGRAKGWVIQVSDELHDPVVRLYAWKGGRRDSAPDKSLEVHTRQVRLSDGEPDESTRTLIRRWLASL